MLEPIEEVVIDVDEEHSGVVVQKMSERKAEMIEMRPSGGSRLRLVFHAPTRGLIGYQGELLTDTRGTAIMNRLFHDYAPWKGEIAGRRNGVLISNDAARRSPMRMWNLEDRGPMMIEPGWKVYQGMIVGEHTRDNDLEVNVLKGKKLTNIRTPGKDEAVRLTPPIRMTLEKALAYIQDDELVEVTPKSIRLRKTSARPERPQARRARQGKPWRKPERGPPARPRLALEHPLVGRRLCFWSSPARRRRGKGIQECARWCCRLPGSPDPGAVNRHPSGMPVSDSSPSPHGEGCSGRAGRRPALLCQ